MAYSEKLAERIRMALADVPRVTEKKMFGGLAFLVRGKNVPYGPSIPDDVSHCTGKL